MRKILCLMLSLMLVLCLLPEVGNRCIAYTPECTVITNGVTLGNFTFSDAVLNAATNGDLTSIKLISDVSLSTDVGLVFATDSDIELDLAGFSITGSFTFKSYGKLKIKDSLSTGGISSSNSTINVFGGSLIVESGGISSSSSNPTIWMMQDAAAAFLFEGGTVNGSICIKLEPYNTLFVDGGTVSGNPLDTRFGIYLNGNNAKCTVSSGNISAQKNTVLKTAAIYMVDACECSILGGNISGNKYGIDSTGEGCTLNIKAGVISGGTYAVYDKANILATDLITGASADGTAATYSNMASYSDIVVSGGDFSGSAAKYVTDSDLSDICYMKAIYNPVVSPEPPFDEPETDSSYADSVGIDWDVHRYEKEEKKVITINEALEYLSRDIRLGVKTEYASGLSGKVYTKANVYIINETDVSEYINILTDAGYTFGYRYYRSKARYDGYSLMLQKYGSILSGPCSSYLNTTGEHGKRYYYRAELLIYEPYSSDVCEKTDYINSKCGHRVYKG